MDTQQAIRFLLEQGELPTKEKIRELTTPEPLIQVEKPKPKNDGETSLKVVQHFEFAPKKFNVGEFTSYFRNRYNFLKNILLNRAETANTTSISRLAGFRDKTTIIAIISDVKKLHTGTLKLTLEDLSGSITAIVSPKNPELAKKMQYLTHDEVLAFKGSAGKDVFFVDDILWPDIPQKTVPTSPDEAYIAFCGDVHAGSNKFLPKEFGKFISWLRGEYGSPAQKELAQKTKYVFLLGDVVDGVGIYPEQKKELDIGDIHRQYDLVAQFLAQVPDDKQIVVIPGNHDAVRLEEYQPSLYKDFAEAIYKIPNVTCVSNPTIVNVHAKDDYPGVDVMLYHGYSFDYFVDSVEALRNAGGYDVPEKVWEFLLKRRHLAPTYGATLSLPFADDPLLIKKIPDVVASGHVHKARIGQYKGVNIVSGSCWQATTNFQIRVGHKPEPAFVPLLNLKTNKSQMLQFR